MKLKNPLALPALTYNKTTFLALACLCLLSLQSCKKENSPPLVGFSNAGNLMVVNPNEHYSIEASASDADGEVEMVFFSVDGQHPVLSTTPPYRFDWDTDGMGAGPHTLELIAIDNKGLAGKAELVAEVMDYRAPYTGDYHFLVITESWMLGFPTTRDTAKYDGIIRLFVPGDSDDDMYSGDDSSENPDEKITILFSPFGKITSLLDTAGQMVPKNGYHYYQSGGFVGTDSIHFSVTGLGGLGGGSNIYVNGHK